MNQARVTLVGASDAGLKGALYDVCSEFLNDSSAWTQDVQINAIPGTRRYAVQVDEGQVLRLVGVTTPPSTQPTAIPEGLFIPALMDEVGFVTLKVSPPTAT